MMDAMELLISAGQILVGPSGERVGESAVLVADSTIAAAGPAAEVEPQASPAATRLSFPGGTVLPGLIDCHVHLAFDASPDPVPAVTGTDDGVLLLGMADRARQLLDTGVTTVRDLGDRDRLALRLRDAIAADLVPGPRILAAGTPVTTPGGHCYFLGGEAAGEEAIRELVRGNADAGADLIKVMATGGGLTPSGPPIWQAQFSADELRVVVSEARRAGLPVAAHAHGTDGIAAAVAADVATVEHCTWISEHGFDVREDVVAAIAARGIAVCPAVSPNWRRFAQWVGPERAEVMFARVGWMNRQGVRLIAGTDAGAQRAGFDGLVASLKFFEHVGISRGRVIEMATAGAAEALGIGTDTGRLAPGFRADLLVVDGDPLEDLDALRHAWLVLAGGKPHIPAAAAINALTARFAPEAA